MSHQRRVWFSARSTKSHAQVSSEPREETTVELLIILGVFVVVDVLAIRYGTDSRPLPRRRRMKCSAILTLDLLALEFGFDSREPHAIEHHERALTAVRNGDIDLCRIEISRMEHDIARDAWRLF